MIQYDQTVKGTFNGIQIIEYGMKNQELEVRFLNIARVLRTGGGIVGFFVHIGLVLL